MLLVAEPEPAAEFGEDVLGQFAITQLIADDLVV